MVLQIKKKHKDSLRRAQFVPVENSERFGRFGENSEKSGSCPDPAENFLVMLGRPFKAVHKKWRNSCG